MKPKASYKYMNTRMLIGLAMFRIEDQLVVSCFPLEVVLLVGVVKKTNSCTIKHRGRIQKRNNCYM
jgi:hypothetical protein